MGSWSVHCRISELATGDVSKYSLKSTTSAGFRGSLLLVGIGSLLLKLDSVAVSSYGQCPLLYSACFSLKMCLSGL